MTVYVAHGKLDVYVYVDTATADVIKVVADDNSLPDLHTMAIYHADPTTLEVLEERLANDNQRAAFLLVANDPATDWPAWEFTW